MHIVIIETPHETIQNELNNLQTNMFELINLALNMKSILAFT